MTGATSLLSERIVLTPAGPHDLDEVVALHRDPRVVAYLIDGIPDEPWKARIYLNWAAGLHARGIGPWSARRRGDGRFLGLFTLTPYVEGDYSLLELGGRLARAGWAGDLAAEAGTLLIGHAFEALGQTRLMSAYHPGNPTVPHILHRLGFTEPRSATVFGKAATAMELTATAWRAQGSRPRPPEARRGGAASGRGPERTPLSR